MAYKAEISRNYPLLIGFLIDQSDSMKKNMADTNTKKSEICAQYIDSFFSRLLIRNTSGEEILNRFNIFALGYGNLVYSAFDSVNDMTPIDLKKLRDISKVIEKTKTIQKKMPDGAGGWILENKDETVKVEQWINPRAENGTPMNEALKEAFSITSDWIEQNHKKSYPPIIINITDGEFTSDDPEPIAREIRDLETDDGKVLLFNIHITDDNSSTPVSFPTRNSFIPPNDYATKLFTMSSNLVDSMVEYGSKKDKPIMPGAVGFAYNAKFEEFIDFLDIGTRPVG